MKLNQNEEYTTVQIDKWILTLEGRLKARELADKLGGYPQLFRMDYQADSEAFPLPQNLVFQKEWKAAIFAAMMTALLETEKEILGRN